MSLSALHGYTYDFSTACVIVSILFQLLFKSFLFLCSSIPKSALFMEESESTLYSCALVQMPLYNIGVQIVDIYN